MNKTLKRVLIAVLTVLALVGLALAISWISSKYKAEYDGEITIEFINQDNKITKNINFNNDDLLENLIKNNFKNVFFDNGMLMNIEDYQTPADFSTFICIYVDGKISEVGIQQIEFASVKNISLIVTEFDDSFYE